MKTFFPNLHSRRLCLLGVSVFLLFQLEPGAWPLQAASNEPAVLPARSSETVPVPLPASADLRPSFQKWNLPGRQQGARGTCSVFTLTGALEFAAAYKQQHGERFSVEFLNWGANRIAGENQDGGFFSDLWKAYATYGICLESTLPYRNTFERSLSPQPEALAEAKARSTLGLRSHWIKEWDVKTGLTDAQLQAIKRTLLQGWPVCGGFRWPKHPHWTNDTLQMCGADDVFDGHSVLIVGYREDAAQPGGGVLLFRNSNNGGHDGYMPYEYALAYMNDAIWIDVRP